MPAGFLTRLRRERDTDGSTIISLSRLAYVRTPIRIVAAARLLIQLLASPACSIASQVRSPSPRARSGPWRSIEKLSLLGGAFGWLRECDVGMVQSNHRPARWLKFCAFDRSRCREVFPGTVFDWAVPISQPSLAYICGLQFRRLLQSSKRYGFFFFGVLVVLLYAVKFKFCLFIVCIPCVY